MIWVIMLQTFLFDIYSSYIFMKISKHKTQWQNLKNHIVQERCSCNFRKLIRTIFLSNSGDNIFLIYIYFVSPNIVIKFTYWLINRKTAKRFGAFLNQSTFIRPNFRRTSSFFRESITFNKPKQDQDRECAFSGRVAKRPD